MFCAGVATPARGLHSRGAANRARLSRFRVPTMKLTPLAHQADATRTARGASPGRPPRRVRTPLTGSVDETVKNYAPRRGRTQLVHSYAGGARARGALSHRATPRAASPSRRVRLLPPHLVASSAISRSIKSTAARSFLSSPAHAGPGLPTDFVSPALPPSLPQATPWVASRSRRRRAVSSPRAPWTP